MSSALLWDQPEFHIAETTIPVLDGAILSGVDIIAILIVPESSMAAVLYTPQCEVSVIGGEPAIAVTSRTHHVPTLPRICRVIAAKVQTIVIRLGSHGEDEVDSPAAAVAATLHVHLQRVVVGGGELVELFQTQPEVAGVSVAEACLVVGPRAVPFCLGVSIAVT